MKSFDDISSYDYDLPDRLIATVPPPERVGSRLMVLDREERSISEASFSSIVELLRAGDLLVFNDTAVVPARLFAKKPTGGRVELLLVDPIEPMDWSTVVEAPVVRAMTRSSKAIRPGPLMLEPDGFELEVIEAASGWATIRIPTETSIAGFLESRGEVPLPPYIVKQREVRGDAFEDDSARYQTVYASKPGAIAAPTAGLHFTPELLESLKAHGVELAFVTLEVGPGTFKPVTAERLSEHEMHSEHYVIPPDLGEAIRATKERGGRVVAVGTTSVRVLESEALLETPWEPGRRDTRLFLAPGSAFKVVDAMITNFHLPRSTLLALVAAFAGHEYITRAYAHAVENDFRFYSYGDSMFIG